MWLDIGLRHADDSALVVRAKFMAKPGDGQYVVRREAYNQIVKAFAESGIRFGDGLRAAGGRGRRGRGGLHGAGGRQDRDLTRLDSRRA
jgi:hypothetical protein